MNIKKNFNYLKQKYNLSFRDISNHTGINLNTLTAISNGKSKNVTIITLLKLTNFFQITLDEFVLTDILDKENKIARKEN